MSETETKLLELLVTGASSKSIAVQLGLKDGTTRVYLHSLYKRIGVNNKTSAVTWYLHCQRAAGKSPPHPPASEAETFADRAVRDDLLSALGMMEIFLGPYGRMWDMLVQLEGRDERVQDSGALRTRSRKLWRAMVRGNFAEAAHFFDQEGVAKLFLESPSDAVVLAASLLLGGFTARATKMLGSLKLKRGGSIGITMDEKSALAALADLTIESRADSALAALHRLIERSQQRPVFRHLLIVSLFHAYRTRNDAENAKAVGNVIWIEAEAARNNLQAMGDETFPAAASLPSPPKLARADVTRYLASLVA